MQSVARVFHSTPRHFKSSQKVSSEPIFMLLSHNFLLFFSFFSISEGDKYWWDATVFWFALERCMFSAGERACSWRQRSDLSLLCLLSLPSSSSGLFIISVWSFLLLWIINVRSNQHTNVHGNRNHFHWKCKHTRHMERSLNKMRRQGEKKVLTRCFNVKIFIT